jgi:hypothetical protein
MKFHERFKIEVGLEDAQRRLVDRLYNELFGHEGYVRSASTAIVKAPSCGTACPISTRPSRRSNKLVERFNTTQFVPKLLKRSSADR